MPIFLDIGTAISKLHSFFFKSVMPVCKVVTNLKFNYRPLHDVNFDDVICTWRRVKNDITHALS